MRTINHKNTSVLAMNESRYSKSIGWSDGAFCYNHEVTMRDSQLPDYYKQGFHLHDIDC